MRYRYSWFFKDQVHRDLLLKDGEPPGGILFVHPTETTMIEDYQRSFALIMVQSLEDSHSWLDAIKELNNGEGADVAPSPADSRKLLRLVKRDGE